MERGYFGIGVWMPKFATNVGTLSRTAQSFGAAFLFTVGRRVLRQASDTAKSYRHIPTFNYADLDDLKEHLPYSCPLIGVELDPRARVLTAFAHPERACYLLGAEDGGLPAKVRQACLHLIQVPSNLPCLNVAVAGSIVLYDRSAKELRKAA